MWKMKVFALLCLVANVLEGRHLSADYYERLGADKSDTEGKLRSAFKKMALKHHPDKNADDEDAHAKMIELNEALEVLTDPELRKAFDARGEKGVEEARKAHGDKGPSAPNGADVKFYENFALYDDDEQVEVVDYHTWEASHSSTETWLINFYSPHCSHCTQMADAWRRVGDRFHNMMHVVAVNCDENFPVCKAAGVQSLPTIKFWPGGTPRSSTDAQTYTPDVQGMEGYEYEKFEKFAMEYLPNAVQTLLPQDFSGGDITPRSNGKTWVIGFCDDDCEEMETRTREVAAMTKGLVPVGSVNCHAFSDLCRALNVDPASTGARVYVIHNGQQTNHATEISAKRMAFDVLAKLERLPKIATEELTKISMNAIEHEHVSKTKEKPKEYLIMFINEDACDHNTHLGPGTASCWKSAMALRQVIKALLSDWEYNDVTVTTFDCTPNARSASGQVKKLCDELAKPDGEEISIVLLKDGALNAEKYTNNVERPNEIVAFIQENFRSVVHELLQEDFDQHILEEKQTWFVDFNAPWCHHCREVWPEYNLASKHYDLPKDPQIHFGKINCEEHHDMCTAQHIRSYPTFLLYHEGVRHQFDFASRTAEEFVRFIKETLEPVEHEFTPDEYRKNIYDPNNRNAEAKGDDGDRWVMDFFAPWCVHCTIMSPKYREAASVLRGVMKFGKVNCELDASFCMQLGIRAYPTIWRFDVGHGKAQPTAKYPGLPDPKKILNFALDGVPDFVEELDTKTFNSQVKTEDEDVSWVVVFHTSKGECEECERLLMKTKALASRYNERQRKDKQAKNDPAAKMQHQVNFGKFDCRATGQAYTFCMKERIKKQPMLVFYSGARNQQSILEKDDMLKVISDIDKHIHDDRRELNHPFREKHTFHFHDEL